MYIDIPTDFLTLNLLSGVKGCVTYTKKMTGCRKKCNLPFYFINVQYFVQFWLPLSATYMLILGELLGLGLLWCQATCKFDISSLPHDGSTCLTTKTEWQCWEDTAVHNCDNYDFMSDLC